MWHERSRRREALFAAAAAFLASVCTSSPAHKFQPLQCPTSLAPASPGQPPCPRHPADVVRLLGGRAEVLARLELAASWLVNTSQVRSDRLPANVDPTLKPGETR